MYKTLYLLLISLLLSFSCNAQSERILIDQELITDWSVYPFFDKLTEGNGDQRQWKELFRYLDSINIYQISYLSDGLKIKGFMASPKENGTYPAVIFNRGGNMDFGAINPAMAASLLGKLANEGYVVIASQYRGNAGGEEGKEEFGGSDVNDVLALIDLLAEFENVDTSNIGMYGWSRGGMMTYIALRRTNRIKAAVVGGAVSNSFKTIDDRPEMESVYRELIPNYDTNKEDELEQRSAIKWADQFPKDVPILILHGNADWRVKVDQSLSLAIEFDKYRIPYRLIIYEGGDHGLSEHRTEVDREVVNWFNRFLKQGEALPKMEYHGK